MSRYFIQPAKKRVKADYEDDWWEEPFIQIPYVCEHDAVETGLIDASGNQIMRAPNPMGFGKDDDW